MPPSSWYVVTLQQYGTTYGVGSDDWVTCFAAATDDDALPKFQTAVIEDVETPRPRGGRAGMACLIRIDGDDRWTEVRRVEVR